MAKSYKSVIDLTVTLNLSWILTWFIQKDVFSVHSVGFMLGGSTNRTCRFSLGKATRLHRVFLNSASGSSG